jgi:four helix bundle protein
MLSYKRLDVYQFSIKFLKISFDINSSLPRGQSKLADQFKRAAMSIPLNIAEAAGKVSPAEAAHHYAIARGSAMECSAILDVIKTARLLCPESLNEGDEILVRIVAMLTKMCR